MKKYAIGVDIGGSHISAVLVDLLNGSILPESLVSKELDNHAPADKIFENWASAIQTISTEIDRKQLAGIGFAMPGPFDYLNGIAMFTPQVAKYENLYDVSVTVAMRNLLGLPQEFPIRYINDATSFALGEAWIGKASGYNRSIAITLGTGFGSAFIESGIPVYERNDVPRYGNFWHLPFKSGIADDFFSTRWFLFRYTEMSGELVSGVKEIAERAENDILVKVLFEEFGMNLGNFMAPWVIKFAAETIVIGGNMTGAWKLFGKSFSNALKQNGAQTDVHLSELGESGAMIGSARLIDESFWHHIKPLYSKM
jgi:glucokinase